MTLEDLLNVESQKLLTATTDSERLSYLSNIIQLKVYSTNEALKLSIYKDIKLYLEYYLDAFEEKLFGYDEINRYKILEVLTLVSVGERISLLKHYQRLLKMRFYEDEMDWCSVTINRFKVNYYLQNFSLKNAVNLLLSLSSYNAISIVLSLLLLFLIFAIILLPSSNNLYAIFSLTYNSYSKNFLINHLMNLLCYLFGIENEFKLTTLNSYAVFLVIFFKSILGIVIINFLLKELAKRITF